MASFKSHRTRISLRVVAAVLLPLSLVAAGSAGVAAASAAPAVSAAPAASMKADNFSDTWVLTTSAGDQEAVSNVVIDDQSNNLTFNIYQPLDANISQWLAGDWYPFYVDLNIADAEGVFTPQHYRFNQPRITKIVYGGNDVTVTVHFDSFS